jgi:hypothetical protein
MRSGRRGVPVDQAAGLRRRLTRQAPHSVSFFSAHAQPVQTLSRAMQAQGWRVLLVDISGRLFAASPTRPLFDWRVQAQRQCLQTLPVNGLEGLLAAGAQAGEPAIVAAASGYDCVLFDAGKIQTPRVALTPDPLQTLILHLATAPESVCNAYALIKTLHQTGNAASVLLWGETMPCERTVAAARTYLGTGAKLPVIVNAPDNDPYTALAARIAAGVAGNRQPDRHTGTAQAQHG